MELSFLVNRIIRIILGKKGIYGKVGKSNHFSEGVIIYENAVIGNYNYVAPYAIINNAHIGNYCSIGPSSMIGLAEHNYHAISTKPDINNGSEEMPLFKNMTIIENDVWIGAHVVIRQGIKVQNGAVIGANSVVLSDIPPYAIAVGSPAKIIKYRFSEPKIKQIQESYWYQRNIKEAKSIVRRIVNENE